MDGFQVPENYNAAAILEHNLARRWQKTALTDDTGSWSYQEVAAQVNRVGNGLASLGVGYGNTVALLARDSQRWVSAFFGVIKVGGIVASLNTLLTPREYQYMLNDCRAQVLIVDASFRPAVEEIRQQLRHLKKIVVIGVPGEVVDTQADDLDFDEWVRAESDRRDAAATHRDDFCCLNYSSGTTGTPKGIFHAHKDLLITAELVGRRTLGLTEQDTTFAVAKLFFTFGTGGNLVFPFYVGASIGLFGGSPRKAVDVFSAIDRIQPTVFYTAPTGYASMLAVPNFTSTHRLKSLRLCVSAGEALPEAIWHEWKAKTGLEIIDGIGSTENYHMFIANRPGEIRPGSSGKPVPGYQARIVDEEGKDVPDGDLGTLWIRGPSAALFYLHQYQRSQKTFRGEWLDTGDKYYRDSDGYYWHAGRSDDMLKVGGIWVSPVEVEAALIQYPDVVECAVIGAEDQSGLVKPKAFVVVRPSADIATIQSRLMDHCRAEMAAYKRPRWIEIVSELPKTATGKIQRYRLR